MALLLLNGTTHEFVHTFTAHEDTIDILHNHKPGEVFFDTEHHHCDFLDIALVVFDHVSHEFNFTLLLKHNANYVVYQDDIVYGKIYLLFGRGPPILHS